MIQIAICDDDRRELELLREIIKENMEQYMVSYKIDEFSCGEDLLKSRGNYQLIFLDIIMAGKNGIEIGYELYRKRHNVKIIFQTNYDQYCKEAMNRSHAFAYLKKPLKKGEVGDQIKEIMENDIRHTELQVAFRNAKLLQGGKETERSILYISVKNIIYFMYLKSQKSIRIVTVGGEFIYKDTIKALEERMRSFGFEISCRGILVNLSKIVKIKRYTIIMSNGDCIPLSQKRVGEFKERMNEYVHYSLS